MDVLSLSRMQFATTVIYHYLFVPLTLGLAIIVAIMETMYVKSNNATYRKMAKFWGQLYLINYALGVVTGLAQEFQFGTNWANYSRFIGNIFGAPLAIETLLAFFVESTFLGIWIFGWDYLPRKLHLATIWLVVVGAYMSVFWILIANGFMQAPVGYVIHNGQAYMTSFTALLTNPNVINSFPHVVGGGFVTGAFFVIAISAYHLRKKTADIDVFRPSLRLGLIVALLGIILVLVGGSMQVVWVRHYQPMKWAAIVENHNGTLSSDPGMNMLQAIYVSQFGAGDYEPPTVLDATCFHIMLVIGVLLFVIVLISLLLLPKGRLFKSRGFLAFLIPCVALPYIANICGWITRETGRQPWIVYKLLTVQQALTPNLSPTMVLISLIGFAALYGILAIIDIVLLFKYARLGVDSGDEAYAEIPQEQVAVF
jgi:cytochrome d ubiquinol oxidase subunit I